jgi:Cytochrome c oxidase subunit IV
MKVTMRIVLGLAIFVFVAGVVYYVSADEWRGSVMLIVLGIALVYLTLVFRGALRRASVPAPPETMEEEEEVAEAHVGPTIWPFVFSLAALLLVVAVVGPHWMVIPGVILLVGAAAGWFFDIKHQWQPGELHAAGAAGSGSVSPLQGEQQPDEADRE